MENKTSTTRPFWFRHFDKLLLLCGGLYLIGVSVWLGQKRQATAEDSATNSGQAVEIITQDDQAFVNYLRQSVETLQQSQTSSAASGQTTPAPDPAITAPTASVAVAPAPSAPVPVPPPAQPTTTVVERHYYPVYPGNSAAPAPPTVAAATPPPAPPPLVQSKTSHDLVGVLEAGDRSSVLFRWNGMTQKIQLGEAIGSSGWMLTSVSGQKAILSRQGKTRYLEVGQGF